MQTNANDGNFGDVTLYNTVYIHCIQKCNLLNVISPVDYKITQKLWSSAFERLFAQYCNIYKDEMQHYTNPVQNVTNQQDPKAHR